MSTKPTKPAHAAATRPPAAFRRAARAVAAAPAYFAAIAIATALVLLLVVPVLLAVGNGFFTDGKFTLYWFSRILNNKVLRDSLYNSTMLAGCATLLSLALALPPAILQGRCRFRGQGILSMLMLAPLILPPFVGALSIRHIFSRFGVLNLALEKIGLLDFSQSLPPDWLGSGFLGVVIIQALHLFPILYLNASAALANIDPAYMQAARNLGAGPWRTFRTVTLPLMRPGLFAGGTIVFIWAFTDVGTPAILGYDNVAAYVIFRELASVNVSPHTYSLVFTVLTASVALYVVGKFLFGRQMTADSTKASIAAERRKLGLPGTAGAWLLIGTVIVLALLPHVGVLLTAVSKRWVNTVLPTEYTLRHLTYVVTRPETYTSILNSLKYAGWSTVVDLVVGCAAAWIIVRSRVRGRWALDALSMLPLAVPGLIMAAGYVALTAPNGAMSVAAGKLFGQWAKDALEGIGPGRNPVILLIVAYSVRRLPFVVRGVSAGLQQVSVSLEEASRNLGASPARTAFRITLPLVAANVVAAAVLTFAFAMLEVSDSLILAQVSSDYPITKQIYALATSGSEDSIQLASALGAYGMALLGATMAVASAILGKRLGAIFRA